MRLFCTCFESDGHCQGQTRGGHVLSMYPIEALLWWAEENEKRVHLFDWMSEINRKSWIR